MSYLNTKEVANLLNYSQRSIQRLVKEKKIIPINPEHSRGYLFDKNYINEKLKDKEDQNV